jgi:hypothetical protein
MILYKCTNLRGVEQGRPYSTAIMNKQMKGTLERDSSKQFKSLFRYLRDRTDDLFPLLTFVLGSLACVPLKLIWIYRSHKQLVGLLGRMMSFVARSLPTQNNTNTECRQT